MGYGEFGGNGSIHWRVLHGTGNGGAPSASDADPIPNANVGQSHGRQGEFRVEITYADAKAAMDAHEAARPRENVLVLHVRANTGTFSGDVPTQVAIRW